MWAVEKQTIMEVKQKIGFFLFLDTVSKGTYGEPNSPKCIKEFVEIN